MATHHQLEQEKHRGLSRLLQLVVVLTAASLLGWLWYQSNNAGTGQILEVVHCLEGVLR